MKAERIQCPASPADGARNDETACWAESKPFGFDVRPHHTWEVVPTEDAYRCKHCGKTYVGGPTVDVQCP